MGRRVICGTVALALGLFVMSVVAGQRRTHGRNPSLATAITDIANLEDALDAFAIDAGRFPTPAEGLNALVYRPPSVPNWSGPYYKRLLTDPWGRPYLYTLWSESDRVCYGLTSAGPDGKPGTADDINDYLP